MEVTELYLLELFRIDLEHIRDYTISDMIKQIEGMYQEIYNLKLSDGITNVSIVNYDFLFYQAVTRSDAFAKRYQKVRDEELMAWKIVVKNSINNLELEKLLDINNIAKTFVYILDGAWFNISYRRNQSNPTNEITKMLTHYYNQIKQK